MLLIFLDASIYNILYIAPPFLCCPSFFKDNLFLIYYSYFFPFSFTVPVLAAAPDNPFSINIQAFSHVVFVVIPLNTTYLLFSYTLSCNILISLVILIILFFCVMPITHSFSFLCSLHFYFLFETTCPRCSSRHLPPIGNI